MAFLSVLDETFDRRAGAVDFGWPVTTGREVDDRIRELGIEGRRYCILFGSASERIAQIHVFAVGSGQITRHVAFRLQRGEIRMDSRVRRPRGRLAA